jgi:hypothetical protein
MQPNGAMMNRKPIKKPKLGTDRLFRRSLRYFLGQGLLRQEISRGGLLRISALQSALNAVILE